MATTYRFNSRSPEASEMQGRQTVASWSISVNEYQHTNTCAMVRPTIEQTEVGISQVQQLQSRHETTLVSFAVDPEYKKASVVLASSAASDFCCSFGHASRNGQTVMPRNLGRHDKELPACITTLVWVLMPSCTATLCLANMPLPKALETARTPPTLQVPAHTTTPPALSIRCRSSVRFGLWSSDRG